MRDFELKLNNTLYKCSSNCYTKDANSWTIRADFHDLKLTMDISEKSKVPMDKILVFISSLDEALRVVQQSKQKDLTFINQLT